MRIPRPVGRLARALCWLLLSSLALLELLDRTGALASLVRATLLAGLGERAEEVEIEHASFSWKHMVLEIEGLHVVLPGIETQLDQAQVALAPWRRGSARVRWASVEGGRVVLERDLLDRLDELLQSEDDGERGALPPIVVRDLMLSALDRDGHQEELALLDIDLDPSPGSRWPKANLALRGTEQEAPRFLELVADAEGAGRWRLFVSAAELDLSRALERPGLLPLELAELSGAGQLAIEGELVLDEDAPPRAELRARLTRTALSIPLSERGTRLSELELAARAVWAPERERSLRENWAFESGLAGRFRNSPFALELLGGAAHTPGSGRLLSGTAQLAALELSPETMHELGIWQHVEAEFAALEPVGHVPTTIGFELVRNAARELTLGLVVEVTPDGRTGIRFHGWPDSTGERQGIPVPVHGISGRAVFAHQSGLARGERLALFGMSGLTSTGIAHGQGMLISPLEGREPDVDLRIDVPYIALDDELAAGLQGMRGTREVWDWFDPRAGELAAHWRLVQHPRYAGLCAQAELEFTDVDMAWHDVPARILDAAGQVRMRWSGAERLALESDGREVDVRELGVAWSLAGRVESGASLASQGFVREELPPSPPGGGAVQRDDEPLSALWLDIDALELGGEDAAIMFERWPSMRETLAPYHAEGSIDADFQGRWGAPAQLDRWELAVLPRTLAMRPEAFPRELRELAGALWVAGESSAASEVAAEESDDAVGIDLALSGRWSDGAQLLVTGACPPGGTGVARILGVGVDSADPELRNTLEELRQQSDTEWGSFGVIELAGGLDFGARVPFDGADVETDEEASYVFHLRENHLRSGDFELSRLRGRADLVDELLVATHLDAELGTTPLSIDDLRYDPSASAVPAGDSLQMALRAAAPTGAMLEATLSATDLPIDEQHLSAFVDEESLRHLLEELSWGGTIDLSSLRMLTTRNASDELLVGMQGSLVTSGMQLELGVPLRVSSARFELERLVIEGDRTSSWLRVEDLYANLAGRRIERAWMNATFLDGRVVLTDLEGVLDGGLLRGVSGTLPAPPAFSMDMRAPHHFALALNFESVDVSAFLRGLLDPAALTEGRLQGELVLQGELGRLLSVHGGGHARLSDARLAGIPVVRELLRVLGIDRSATFDEMSTRFSLSEGHVAMHELRMQSPLADLMGVGSLDLSGGLSHRFDVRFAPAPLLGPLEPIWALLQNQILWIEIDGDLRRPVSNVRLGPIQPFSELMGEDAKQRGLLLPVPRYTSPSRRF